MTPRQCLRICQVMQSGEDRLMGHGDEVIAGNIVRMKPDNEDQ